MRDQQVTCPYCGAVILSADALDVLSHYETDCRQILTTTSYRDPKTRLCYRWAALHGWRLYRGALVLDKVTFDEVVAAVASGVYVAVKQKDKR